MMIHKGAAVLSLGLLTGCGSFSFKPPEPLPPQIITVKEFVPLEIYQPPRPAPVEMLDVTFFVITEENIQEQIEKIESLSGGQFVIFALTPDGYHKMAANLQEIRRFVRQQNELIVYYRDATDPGDSAEEWLEKNETQENQQKGQDGPSETGNGSVNEASDPQG